MRQLSVHIGAWRLSSTYLLQHRVLPDCPKTPHRPGRRGRPRAGAGYVRSIVGGELQAQRRPRHQNARPSEHAERRDRARRLGQATAIAPAGCPAAQGSPAPPRSRWPTRSTQRPGHRWRQRAERCSGSPTIDAVSQHLRIELLLQVRHREAEVRDAVAEPAASESCMWAVPSRLLLLLLPQAPRRCPSRAHLSSHHPLTGVLLRTISVSSHHLVADDASLAGLPERLAWLARGGTARTAPPRCRASKLASTQISRLLMPTRQREMRYSPRRRSSFVTLTMLVGLLVAIPMTSTPRSVAAGRAVKPSSACATAPAAAAVDLYSPRPPLQLRRSRRGLPATLLGRTTTPPIAC